MRKGNGVLIALLTLALTMGLCPGVALAASYGYDGTSSVAEASLPANGIWGSCAWDIDDEGTLTVNPGEGFETAGVSPWKGYETVVKRVVFVKGTQGGMVIAPAECGALFKDFGLLESVDFSGFDTSQVMYMDKMFSGCLLLRALDLSAFDTSQVRSMNGMFFRCSSLATLKLAGLDTSSVTDMGNMFRSCTSLASLDLSGIKTSQVKNMGEMFSGCSSLASLDLSGFDTSMVTDMNYMFYNCSSLSSLDISAFDTSKLVSYSLMFEGCKKLALISVSPKATNISLPRIEVNGHADWFSVAERKWFTVGEIESSRRGIADTYAKEEINIPLDTLSIELSQSKFTYDGTEKKPVVTVKHGDRTLVEGRDYSITYPESSVNVGTYSVTVTGMGTYSGTRGLSFEITPAPEKPDDPKPVDPDNPSQPSNPDEPSNPTGPDDPSAPNDPDATDKPGATDPEPDDADKPGTSDPEPVATQVMYRAYNPNSGEHFYTAHYAEVESIVAAGWRYEGEAWTAPVTSATPVYRLYSGTDHHYTTSVVERDHLVSVGWSDEGIGWYSDDNEAVGLHRLFNPNVDPNAPTNNSGSHHYTTSEVERDHLVSIGWRYEDFGWYGVK
ncbi:MAG: hypothetical protein DBY20_04605 [Coriobacteriia bacterium]|nr:MAG: hypothetical protein DBY20_04605 [Coriobacteriia bacterium]